MTFVCGGRQRRASIDHCVARFAGTITRLPRAGSASRVTVFPEPTSRKADTRLQAHNSHVIIIKTYTEDSLSRTKPPRTRTRFTSLGRASQWFRTVNRRSFG
ncbi:MAG: hypothetical protein BJ554DRAFT_4280 [Olpidium bornovanus]|uniref:Uncharacterized protein n=1 Tax=Olpidium bornovanus TaxID=278681 RepID=A0A8H8A0D5_9FUNG|nr:MAG: hypothetical protein BJ554DRAFT_4280 [Olpidium bornovanus]